MGCGAQVALPSSLVARPAGILQHQACNPSILMIQGKELYGAGRLAESEAVFQRVIEAGGDFSEAGYCIGMVRFSFGDYEGAARWFEAVQNRNPGHTNALFQLGVLA